MAKRNTKRKPIVEALDGPTPEQEANGSFDVDFVTHVESNTKAKVYYRKDGYVLEKWIRKGGVGFDQGACRVISDCQLFWSRIKPPRTTSQYGERIASSTADDGWTASEALDQIAHMSKGIPKPYWDVFENVVRHGEPAGVSGSRFANNTAQAIASAKVITGFVASLIAERLGY